MEYYIYSHLDINTDKCFYIGKGKDSRCADGSANTRNSEWTKKVMQDGGFKWKILVSGLAEETAIELEKSFIEQIGYGSLLNISPEEKGRKISLASAGRSAWNKGIKRTEATKNKLMHSRGTKIEFEGETYPSIRQCHRITGRHRDVIKKYCTYV